WVALLVLIAFVPARADDEPIGFIKTLSGSATIQHGGTASEPAHLGAPLHQTDRVETGPDGTVGITLRDNTRLSLGPKSRVEVASFVFKPAEKQYSLVIRLLQGTLGYISGITAKLAPESVSIQTPTATVGVRGTRMLIRTEE